MFLEILVIFFLVDEIGVPLIQRDIIRITPLSKLVESKVPIQGKEQCIFVPNNRSVEETVKKKKLLLLSLFCSCQLLRFNVEANFGTGRTPDSK